MLVHHPFHLVVVQLLLFYKKNPKQVAMKVKQAFDLHFQVVASTAKKQSLQ
jgi:hypothetical protein